MLLNHHRRQGMDDQIFLNLNHNLILVKHLGRITKEKGRRKGNKDLIIFKYFSRIVHQKGSNRIGRIDLGVVVKTVVILLK